MDQTAVEQVEVPWFDDNLCLTYIVLASLGAVGARLDFAFDILGPVAVVNRYMGAVGSFCRVLEADQAGNLVLEA